MGGWKNSDLGLRPKCLKNPMNWNGPGPFT